MTKTKADTAPAHLSPEAKTLWAALMNDYDISDSAGRALLRVACEAFERAEQARAAIKRTGAVCKDRFGQPRASPWVNIERDARAQMVAALRALRLAPEEAS
jgi:P27 family predicted phage terminase small subunit